jgi:hypothetical protein
MTAQSTVATRRWRGPAIVTLAAMAALALLTAEAAPRQAQPAPTTEATAPREAGEPIIRPFWFCQYAKLAFAIQPHWECRSSYSGMSRGHSDVSAKRRLLWQASHT